MKYHIKKDGTPGICKAKDGNCPLSRANEHFDTMESAERGADTYNAAMTGNKISNLSKVKGSPENVGVDLAIKELSSLASQAGLAEATLRSERRILIQKLRNEIYEKDGFDYDKASLEIDKAYKQMADKNSEVEEKLLESIPDEFKRFLVNSGIRQPVKGESFDVWLARKSVNVDQIAWHPRYDGNLELKSSHVNIYNENCKKHKKDLDEVHEFKAECEQKMNALLEYTDGVDSKVTNDIRLIKFSEEINRARLNTTKYSDLLDKLK